MAAGTTVGNLASEPILVGRPIPDYNADLGSSTATVAGREPPMVTISTRTSGSSTSSATAVTATEPGKN